MPSVRHHFDNDFPHTFKFNKPVEARDVAGNLLFTFTAKVHLDLVAGGKFVSLYFEEAEESFLLDLIRGALPWVKENTGLDHAPEATLPSDGPYTGARLFILKTETGVKVRVTLPGEADYDCSSIPFSGTVFVYAAQKLTAQQIEHLSAHARTLSLTLRFRGPDYAVKKAEAATHVFICHDHLDKEAVARPLAEALALRGVKVWFDEYSLRPGDSLRESIERGLKEAQKCILVLTPNFLQNPGWTKTEFNSVFTREILEGRRLVLPIWCGIDKHAVYAYSPSLLDVVGVHWSEAGKVADSLRPALQP